MLKGTMIAHPQHWIKVGKMPLQNSCSLCNVVISWNKVQIRQYYQYILECLSLREADEVVQELRRKLGLLTGESRDLLQTMIAFINSN